MIHAKIEGLDKVQQYLRDKQKRADDAAIGKIVKQAAKPIIAAARARVPVDSGLLRKQIGFISRQDAKYPTTALIGVNYNFQGSKRGNSAWYAHIVEYGGKTVNRAPHPFMRPAFKLNEDRARKHIKAGVLKLLNIKETK
jgi:HK97 gp10 family phage protein